MEFYLYSILITPVISISLNVLIYPLKAISKNIVAWFFIFSSFILLVFSSFVFFGYQEPINNDVFNYTFFKVDNLTINFSIFLNPLTAVMLFVVCSVSFLVHVFSLGYMSTHEYPRYYIYLHLFTWAMLGLVLAGNIIQMFVFWELVGLCSYSLIGFWYDKKSATDAAKKAFIITRIGDFGFMIGILYLIANLSNVYGPLTDFVGDPLSIIALNESLQGSEIALIFSLGILLGAIGKSAQFPLHTWLPDAMEGPTPVSALIHAATMVAAGVFLIGRFLPVFPEEALIITALIGAITAFGAALLGTVMNDVKKVLAYSTISQLGYMVMALGMSLYTAAFFHLFTHAFFKALLFLVAGSLSHAVGTFDMKKMGGLRKLMPWTYLFFIIGTFSLVGLFPFSGFWSKDEILAQISHKHTIIGDMVYYLGSAAVFLTSFYMFRAFFMIFNGRYDKRKNPGISVHESGLILLVPMGILAIASVIFGFLFNPTIDLGYKHHWFNYFINPDFHAHEFDFGIAIISHLIVFLGILAAYLQYRYAKPVNSLIIKKFNKLLLEKYYLDIFYERIIVGNLLYKKLIGLLNHIDLHYIDDTWNKIATYTKLISGKFSSIQNGQLQLYSLGIPLGIIIISFLVILWR